MLRRDQGDSILQRYFILLLFTFLLSCSESPLTPLADDAKILAFGDSLTEGKGVKQEESYPAELQRLIQKRVVNAGISGETTAEGLKRIEKVLNKEKPDLVVLMEGGNDILRNYNLKETESNLGAMIEIIQARGIPVALMGIPVKSLFSSSCASFYEDLADKYTLPLDCDSVGELLRDSRYKSDSVHFNKEGYALIAKRVEELLKDSGALP